MVAPPVLLTHISMAVGKQTGVGGKALCQGRGLKLAAAQRGIACGQVVVPAQRGAQCQLVVKPHLAVLILPQKSVEVLRGIACIRCAAIPSNAECTVEVPRCHAHEVAL